MLVEVTIIGTYGGQGHVNVLHFVKQEDHTLTEYMLLGGIIQDLWVGTIRGVIDATMSWGNIKIRDINSTPHPPYEWPISTAGVLGPSLVYCPFLTGVFLLNTGVQERRGRGRFFQAGFGHGASYNAGRWLQPTKNALDAVADALRQYFILSNAGSRGWKLVVAPRNVTNEVDALFLETIIGSSKVGTMNSRKIGRGM